MSHFLVFRHAGATEGLLALRICLASPARNKISGNTQFSGNLGIVDTWLTYFVNCACFKLGAVLYSLRNKYSFCPLWGFFEVSVKSG